ncbi:MAG: hypothetical protein JWP12_299 [Bacteroidetes bacterium]|nr:hypothetical protein [Bacteroidota bacterium]
MKKIIVVFLLLLQNIFPGSAQSDCSGNSHSSFFGERAKMLLPPAANVVRVFMDKSGFYYPDMYIADEELERYCSSLKEWYAANPEKLKILCDQYRVDHSLSADEKISRLNDSVAKSYVRVINQKTKEYPTVDVLIHGFRKKAYGNVGGTSSYSINDYERFENVLSGAGTKNLYVEIYWDGKFITPAQSYKYRGFKLFENSAIPNAGNAGVELRRVVSFIDCENLNVITHSLGARVGCELLFNASKAGLPDEKILQTPAQKNVHLCMIEPAIGADLFDDYYSRNTTLDYKNKDNYKLGMVYNENDFVLLKNYQWKFIKIVSSPLEYGNTSLGCNYQKCIPALQKTFAVQYPNSVFETPFNFSNVGGDHRLFAYSRDAQFAKVMAFLND